MGFLMVTLQLAPYGLIALIALAAVMNSKFEDTLTQRIGLSMICFGAALRLMAITKESPSDIACLILAYGLVVYAIGTTIKLKREGKL
jgi:hypothetical protein